jgi:hypothetical protein
MKNLQILKCMVDGNLEIRNNNIKKISLYYCKSKKRNIILHIESNSLKHIKIKSKTNYSQKSLDVIFLDCQNLKNFKFLNYSELIELIIKILLKLINL